MDFRKYAPAAGIVLVLWALWLLWLWQPERQVRLHTTHFLKNVERRNWGSVGNFMAADYSDRWGHEKKSAIEGARTVFSQFLFLNIENRTARCETNAGQATTDTVVKISGTGGPLGQVVMERVNSLGRPFIFTWRKVGSAPWNWELIRIDHPDLNVDPSGVF